MKSYVYLLLVGLMGLVISCKDDDDPTPPKLNKLAKVTCYQDNMSTPSYVVNITYTNDGNIANIEASNQEKQIFTYSNNKILVVSLSADKIEYTINKDKITEKKISTENKNANNEVYISDEYTYKYQGTGLVSVDWLTRRPATEGSGYNIIKYEEDQKFNWNNGNTTLFSQDKKAMVYEYSSQSQPANFPFRVIASFNPVEFDIVNPINLLYGYQNNQLPSRAYWYNQLEPGTICAEYTYKFEGIGDYITGMTIEEKDHLTNQDNIYKFDFQYLQEAQ